MIKYFKSLPKNKLAKKLEVLGPYDIKLSIDYDDVWHAAVDIVVPIMLDILNEAWNKQETRDLVIEKLRNFSNER